MKMGVTSLATVFLMSEIDKKVKGGLNLNAFIAECAKIRDKFLDRAVTDIEDGIRDIQLKYPSIQKPLLNYGLRGTRYFIEFPITGRNIDLFSILANTQQVINEGKTQYGARISGTDSFVQDENISYLIDYDVNSTTANGAKSKGSIYIRGIKGDEGFDSYKFILEKNVDFSPLDIKVILGAYENAFKPRAVMEQPQQPIKVEPRKRFGAKK